MTEQPEKESSPFEITSTPEIVHVSSGSVGGMCRVCSGDFGDNGNSHFDREVNHYLVRHGGKLLHVGQETEGGTFQNTVAVIAVPKTGISASEPEQIDVTEMLTARLQQLADADG